MRMKSSSRSSISIFLNSSKKNICEKRLIGNSLSLLTINRVLTSSKGNSEFFPCSMKRVGCHRERMRRGSPRLISSSMFRSTSSSSKKSRFGNTSFTICHYALDVTYESEGFLEKNRDTVPDEQMEVLLNTSNELLKQMLAQAAAIRNSQAPPSSLSKRPGAAAKKPTLGSIFKASLNNLMDTINSTNVHYIRCIKPNEDKAAWQFDSRMVLAQLRACGVLETIRISCAGFPTRWTFAEFASRYYLLVNSSQWDLDEIRAFSLDILKRDTP